MTRYIVIAAIAAMMAGTAASADAQEVSRRHKTYPKKYYKPARERDEEHAAKEAEREGRERRNPDRVKPSRRDKWSRKLEESDSLRAVRVQDED